MFHKIFLIAVIFLSNDIPTSESRKVKERFGYLQDNVNITIASGKVIDPDRDYGGMKIADILTMFKGFRYAVCAHIFPHINTVDTSNN